MCALVPNVLVAPLAKTVMAFCHFHPLAKVDLPPFVEDFHLRWILFWIERHLFMLWHVHHVFHPIILWIWCMNFYEIVLFLMILQMILIFFLRYVGISLMVMFLHQYHAYLLHRNYWLWRKQAEGVWPSWLNRLFID